MKKIIKNNLKLIMGLFIGCVISGISVYAATTYLASDINYTTSKNNSVKNVKDAIDDLYNKEYSDNRFEYLNNYESNNYICSTCGGVASKPGVSVTDNIATINITNADNAQGTSYIYIEDISKYKSIISKISGKINGIYVFLLSGKINNKYEINTNSLGLGTEWQSKGIALYNSYSVIDTSNLTGEYTLIFFTTYASNLKIETKAYLK